MCDCGAWWRFPLAIFVPFCCLFRAVFAFWTFPRVSESYSSSWRKERGQEEGRQRESCSSHRQPGLGSRADRITARQSKARHSRNSPAHISPIQPLGTKNAPPIESTYPPQVSTSTGTQQGTYKAQTGTGRPTIPRVPARRDPIDPTTTSRERDYEFPRPLFLSPSDYHELIRLISPFARSFVRPFVRFVLEKQRWLAGRGIWPTTGRPTRRPCTPRNTALVRHMLAP